MTKVQAKYLMAQVVKNCSHITKVRRNHIVFSSQYWALEAYRYVFQGYDLSVSAGMEMLGGDRIVYFPWKKK